MLAGAAVLSEVAYPLVRGGGRDVLAEVTVACFAGAVIGHAARARGPRAGIALVLLAGGVGFTAEAVGVATGFPFGRYHYTGRLGPQLLGVPVLVPVAWVMMSYPAIVLARRVTAQRWTVVPLGAVALASWDLFLDPQMVRAGFWRWTQPGPRLAGIPLTNDAGWLGVALVVSAGLALVLPARTRPGTDDRLPVGLYLWSYGSSLLANLAFFDRPLVAAVGGVGMGVVVLALLHALRVPPPARRGERRQVRSGPGPTSSPARSR